MSAGAAAAAAMPPGPPEMPQVGDVVGFGHPDYFGPHRFYTAFPYGRKIRAEEAFVDLRQGVRVLEIATAAFDRWPEQGRAGRRSAGRLTASTEVEVDVYVGIRFVSRHGTQFWTNWSKNEHQRVHFVRDAVVLV